MLAGLTPKSAEPALAGSEARRNDNDGDFTSHPRPV